MVTLQRNKVSEFDENPEFDIVQKELKKLKQFACNAPASQCSYRGGPYLYDKLISLRSKDAVAVKTIDPFDDGNCLFPTIFNFTSFYLTMQIDISLVGATEGRGEIEVKPKENGFILQAQEWDLCKHVEAGEVHAIKRLICREYLIHHSYNWMRMVYSISPDGILNVKVPIANNMYQTFC